VSTVKAPPSSIGGAEQQQQPQTNQKHVTGFDQHLALEAKRDGREQVQHPARQAAEAMAEKPRPQQRHEHACQYSQEMLRRHREIDSVRAAKLVQNRQEHRVEQRP
jgi:hypothetical protein